MTKTLKGSLGTTRKRIVIVDDHPTFREGLALILEDEEDLVVCGEAGNAIKGLEAVARLKPDLLLLDITMPGDSGLDLLKKLRKVNREVKVLVISMHDEALYASRVLRAGADGYIMKEEDPEEIVQAIRDVLKGFVYVSEEVSNSIKPKSTKSPKAESNPIENLTDDELEVLELLGQGESNKNIAHELDMSIKFVATQRQQIARKLHLKSIRQLPAIAARWVESQTI